MQDIRIGGRGNSALYQFTILSDNLNELRAWGPKIRFAMMDLPELIDVNTDAQDKGLQTTLTINRDAAAKFGLTPAIIDSTLGYAFGQTQVSTIFNPLNQYHVVLEVAPKFWQSPEILNQMYFSTSHQTHQLFQLALRNRFLLPAYLLRLIWVKIQTLRFLLTLLQILR